MARQRPLLAFLCLSLRRLSSTFSSIALLVCNSAHAIPTACCTCLLHMPAAHTCCCTCLLHMPAADTGCALAGAVFAVDWCPDEPFYLAVRCTTPGAHTNASIATPTTASGR